MTMSPELMSAPEAQDDAAALPSATLGGDSKGSVEQIALASFIVVPFVALLAAVPLAWGRG